MKNWKKQIALAVTAGLLTVMGAATAFAASKTRLDTVTDLYWGDDGTTANWEKIDDAYQYEVRLYCNESQVESIKTKKDSFDMEKKMTKEGDYTFRVRALAKSNSKEFTDGYWSEDSEETYVSADFADMIKNGGSTSQLRMADRVKKKTGQLRRRKRLLSYARQNGSRRMEADAGGTRMRTEAIRRVAGGRSLQPEPGISSMHRDICRLAGSTGMEAVITAQEAEPWQSGNTPLTVPLTVLMLPGH